MKSINPLEAPRNWSEHQGEILPPDQNPPVGYDQLHKNDTELRQDHPEFAHSMPDETTAEVTPIFGDNPEIQDAVSRHPSNQGAAQRHQPTGHEPYEPLSSDAKVFGLEQARRLRHKN